MVTCFWYGLRFDMAELYDGYVGIIQAVAFKYGILSVWFSLISSRLVSVVNKTGHRVHGDNVTQNASCVC